MMAIPRTVRRVPAGALLTVVLVALTGAPSSAAENGPLIITEPLNPWTHLDLRNDPEAFQFAIVTDRTGGHRPGVFPDAVRKLNLLQPEFVMSVGDLIEGYTEDRETLDLEWEEFTGFVEALEMPFFYTPGNHDISNAVMAEVWAERFGRAYYHFVYRDVLFLCLNSEDGDPTHLGEAQLEYIEATLAANADVRWTLVFLHKPMWEYRMPGSEELLDTGWTRVEALLRERPHTVFAGHFHQYTKHRRNDANYFVLATTGGGSSLLGPLYGQFDHVVWVTMTSAGPRLANLLLEGIWDENVRTAAMASMVDQLLQGDALAVSPIMVEEGPFSAGAATLRLTNDADVPLHLQARAQPHASLQVTPDSVAVVVPPNSVELVKLQVQAGEPRAVQGLPPVVFAWTAEYEQDEHALPTLEGSLPLVISTLFDAARRTTPVTVDGQLDEWTDLPFHITQPAQIDVAPESWQGPADCSWRFAVAVDDEYLYVAVEVTDERRIYLGANAWSQDGIEVRLDGRPEPARSANRGYGENGDHLLVGLSPGHTADEALVYAAEYMDEVGVLAAFGPTATGHAYEIAVPLAYLEERQGPDWDAFRLNIAVDDYDEETGPLAQLWWQPDWRDNTNYPGSGTFRRPR